MKNLLSLESFKNFDEFVEDSLSIILESFALKIVLEIFAPALWYAMSFAFVAYYFSALRESHLGNNDKFKEHQAKAFKHCACMFIIGFVPAGIIPYVACALIIFRSYDLIRSALPNDTKIGSCLKSIEDFFNKLPENIANACAGLRQASQFHH